jgi:malonyl CoA-acyl carrier protein transacylase
VGVRPLRELIAGAGPPVETGPVEPLAVLSVVGRPEPAFDPARAFDRSLFGLRGQDVRALGAMVPHLLELAYEAFERSGLPFGRIGSLRFGTWTGTPASVPWSRGDGAEVARVLGLPGPVFAVAEAGASALLAIHAASQAIRAQEVDVALVLGDLPPHGAGAVVLGRPEVVAAEGGKVRSVLLGSAAARPGVAPEPVPVAARRAGIDVANLRAVGSPGFAGLQDVLLAHERSDRATFVVRSTGETAAAAVVLGPPEDLPVEGPGPWILRLSARSPTSLHQLARRTAVVLATEDDLAGVASDALARPEFEYRAAVPAHGVEDVRSRLASFADGGAGRVAAGRSSDGALAFVIPPAGAQLAHAGDELYTRDDVFREALNRCDRALRSVVKRRPLLSVLYPARPDEEPLDEPVYANAVTVALAWALAEVYRSRDVVPSAVLGCGVGELAAAAICGAIDLEDALRLAARRGELLEDLRGDAALAMVGVTEAQIRELIVDLPGVDVVAVPMPDRVVVGGEPAAVDQVVAAVRAAGAKAQLLTGHGAHTPLVDPIVGPWEAAFSDVTVRPAVIPWVSAATGRRIGVADAAHWGATLRAPLRFADGVGSLDAMGCTSFVELAARPTLVGAGERTLSLSSGPTCWLTALDPQRGASSQLAEVLSELWVRGIDVDPGARIQPHGAAELPTYAWDRRAHEAPTTPPAPMAVAPGEANALNRTQALREAQRGADTFAVWAEQWVEDPVVDPAPSEPSTWMLLHDTGGLGEELAARLSADGHTVLRVFRGAAEGEPTEGAVHVAQPLVPGGWEHVVEAIGTLMARVHIVHLWGLDGSDDPGAGWAGLLALVNELMGQGLPGAIHVVTRRAVLAPEMSTAAAGGALWGAAGLLAAERSGVLHGIVDIDPEHSNADALYAHLGAVGWPPPVALPAFPRREHALRGRRMRRMIERVPSVPDERPLDTAGAWVLAGAVDAPLLELGRLLVDLGVSRLLFLTVEPPPPEVLRGVLDLQRHGVSCLVVRADPSEARDVDLVRSRLAREGLVSGMVLRTADRPARLDRLVAADAVHTYQRSMRELEALLDLAPSASFWLWSESHGLDPEVGGGVGAVAAASMATRLESLRATGRAISVIHSAAAASLAPGQAARLVLRLGRAGGTHGLWRAR